MIITDLDKPITAEEARQISLNNRDESFERYRFRTLMEEIKEAASYGKTRLSTAYSPKRRELFYPQETIDAVKALGFKVVVKRAVHYCESLKDFDQDRPILDSKGREQFFIEVYWG